MTLPEICYACGQTLLPEVILPIYAYGRGIFLVDTEKYAACPTPNCEKNEGGGGYYRGKAVPDKYIMDRYVPFIDPPALEAPLFLRYDGSWQEVDPDPAILSRWEHKSSGIPARVLSYVSITPTTYRPIDNVGVLFVSRRSLVVIAHHLWYERFDPAKDV